MSEEKSIPSLSKSITKKPCSWKQTFRKKLYEDQKKKEQLKKLRDEILKTEEFLQRTWSLIAAIIQNRQKLQKNNQ